MTFTVINRALKQGREFRAYPTVEVYGRYCLLGDFMDRLSVFIIFIIYPVAISMFPSDFSTRQDFDQ